MSNAITENKNHSGYSAQGNDRELVLHEIYTSFTANLSENFTIFFEVKRH